MPCLPTMCFSKNIRKIKYPLIDIGKVFVFILLLKNVIMGKVSIVVSVVTLFALVCQLAPYIAIPDKVTLFMFIISPFVVIYMVYVILKYGKPSGNTFDEKYYED